MGCKFSKRIRVSSHNTAAAALCRTTSNWVYSPDPSLSSYDAACPDLRNFDSSLQPRTSRAINSIPVNLDVPSVSLDSPRDALVRLLENQKVVKKILQNKRDNWKDTEFSDLVDDCLKNSIQTLDSCTALESCLKRASHFQSIINVALRKFEEEQFRGSEYGSVKNYSRTLEELRNFRGTDGPFNEEFFNLFNSVYKRQNLMLEKLQAGKRKLDKKLGKLKAWKKVSTVIFVVAFASALICSVVAAAVSAPPVFTALAAAALVPLGPMGKWLNSIWMTYENELMGQREILFSMQFENYIMIDDLDGIRASIDRFQIMIKDLLVNVDFAMRGDEAVVIALEEMKKNVNGFMEKFHDLNERANKCRRGTRMARASMLQRILNHPNGLKP